METVQEKENAFALIAFIKYGNVFGMLTGEHTLTGSTHTRIRLRKFLSPSRGMVLLILAPALGHPASCNGQCVVLFYHKETTLPLLASLSTTFSLCNAPLIRPAENRANGLTF